MLGEETRTRTVTIDGDAWRASVSPLRLEGVAPLYIVTASPESELLAGALRLAERSALATLIVLLLTIPFTWLLAPGSWLLAPGSWLLAPGSWLLAPGSWLLAPGSWLLAPGSWLLAPGSWLLAPGSWLLAPGSWLLAPGSWLLAPGAQHIALAGPPGRRSREDLFEAFIQLIAGAIDAKSSYTGGHCARVPELTKMLARAACEQKSGSYRDFHLTDDDWETLHVAAWLHDCGKVTTPEYVVDKATKLETIHDRIHEVRMRFEVLKRDAEVASLRAVATGKSEQVANSRLTAELVQLDDDFTFVAACNLGGESMAPEKLARLQTIAGRRWLRTLDDRLGISHEEQQRKARTPAAVLPVAEALLADKPEHQFPRLTRDQLPEDKPWGFRMSIPSLLYNRGELYNLAVERGTLSAEERYKINEHIAQTLIMLAQLPFPKHLSQVPEIAGGHHEKMDGSGYPRRLSRTQMSPLARMMAIADIFEALTASDRPHKKGKTLSAAIAIMARMQQQQHVDAELFALFLRSGVYLDYAERFMQPEQVDRVDIDGDLAGRGNCLHQTACACGA
jgi:HD-GYP domain-containing protein (c-di-GMP phosphodiesterase class II)